MKIERAGTLAIGAAFVLGAHAGAAGEPVTDAKAAEAQVLKSQEEVRRNEEELRRQLEAARERLEAAAREVAQLSSQLTGPVMHDFIMQRGKSRAILGINIGEADSADGVVIDSVSPGGPASKAGLKAGDVIVSIDGKRLSGDGNVTPKKLVRHMRSVEPGARVQLEYLRDGRKQKIDVVTEEMRPERFAYSPDGRLLVHPAHPAAPAVPAAPAAPAVRVFPGFESFMGRGMLDMELITLTPKLGSYFGADKGVLVVRAPKESELKLEEGDVIVDIDGRVPTSGVHALRILRSYQPGEKVSVSVLRNRRKVKVEATLPKQERVSWNFTMDGGEMLEDAVDEAVRAVEPALESLAAPEADAN